MLLLDTVIKATVLLVGACLAAALLRRASAAVRHRVWCLAFLALILLPFVPLALPTWRLPILPIPIGSPGASLADAAVAVRPVTPNLAGADGAAVGNQAGGNPVGHGARTTADLDWMPHGGQAAPLDSVPAMNVSSSLSGASVAADRTIPAMSWRAAIGVMWLAGLALSLLPLAASLIRNRILRRNARPVVAPERQRLLAELCRRVGVRRRIRLLETEKRLVPMTWGVVCPIVLVPGVWREWPLQRQRIVLVHELAHVKRCDAAFQLLARLACTFYWFHPLVWYALRRLRIERELACDDCVLMAGERPSDYAQQLLGIARDCRVVAMPAVLAMAHSTSLERRVRALLDEAHSHLPISRAAGRLAFLCAALVLTGVAAVGPASTLEPQTRPSTASAIALAEFGKSEPRAAAATAASAGETPSRDAENPSKRQEGDLRSGVAAGSKAGPEREQREAERQASEPRAERGPGRDSKSDETRLEYRGQVVDPEGRAVPGAKIFLCYWLPGAPLDYVAKPRAVTDREGRFEFTTTRADFEPSAGDVWRACGIAAAAEGYGFAADVSLGFETTGKAVRQLSAEALAYYLQRLQNPKRVLQLVRDDTPIRGQVRTADGQPVSGARIRVKEVWMNDAGDLSPWEKAAQDKKADYYSLRRQTPHLINGPHLPFLIPDVTTDQDGRFTLRGVGRERIVEFLLSGPGIESGMVKARARSGEKVVVPHQWRTAEQYKPARMETFYAANFVHVAGPSKPVVGRVIDADTSKPIPGALVSAGQQGTFFSSGLPFVATMTDAEGRYRLEGMPIGKENSLYVFPPETTAYLPAGLPISTQVAEPSVTRDFQLKPGVWVRGRAIDDRTGKPARGRVQYRAFRDNPQLKSFPLFSRGGITHERRTDDDGRFEIAVMPGPGIISFVALDHTRYRRGLGAETITGSVTDVPTMDANRKVKMFNTVPTSVFANNEHLLRQIDPEDGSKPMELTLTLTSGADVTGRLLDPEGKRLSGGIVSGNVFEGAWYPIHGDEFRVEGYFADRPRELFFYHPERDLAGHCHLEGQPPAQLTVTLRPAGGVRGRLVGDSGAPLPRIVLRGEGVPGENYGDASLRLGTDENGRFHIRGLIPGRTYTVVGMGERIYGRVLTEVSVEPGTTKDVGDVKLQVDNKATELLPGKVRRRPDP
jgi:beta-lactamase regulating signal transducer with metallopeptidase domain/protocatechuate 3,4-dioxygenase beta subunit